MNVPKPQAEAIKAITYIVAESLPLCRVAAHSCYLVGRQSLVFAETDWGKRAAQFLNMLQPNQRVRPEYRASLTSNVASLQVLIPSYSGVNASPKMLFTVSFTSPFTLTHSLDLSLERAYLRFECGSCPRPNHRVGLERPHFFATETVAVAPAQPSFVSTRRIAEPYTDVPNRVGRPE